MRKVSKLLFMPSDHVVGYIVMKIFRCSIWELREGIRSGILHPYTQLGNQVYDTANAVNWLLWERTSDRSGAQMPTYFSDMILEAERRHAVYQMKRERGQISRDELPSPFPRGWVGLDLSTHKSLLSTKERKEIRSEIREMSFPGTDLNAFRHVPNQELWSDEMHKLYLKKAELL